MKFKNGLGETKENYQMFSQIHNINKANQLVRHR